MEPDKNISLKHNVNGKTSEFLNLTKIIGGKLSDPAADLTFKPQIACPTFALVKALMCEY